MTKKVEGTCRVCGDLKRAYSWACNDLRVAARKMVRSNSPRFQEAVDQAKAQKKDLAARLNEHRDAYHQGAA